MHIIDPTRTECSKCGSGSWEGFHRPGGMSGVRCLSCGHEKINQPANLSTSLSSQAWQPPTVNKF